MLVGIAVGFATSPVLESASTSAIGAILEFGLVDTVKFFDLNFGSHVIILSDSETKLS